MDFFLLDFLEPDLDFFEVDLELEPDFDFDFEPDLDFFEVDLLPLTADFFLLVVVSPFSLSCSSASCSLFLELDFLDVERLLVDLSDPLLTDLDFLLERVADFWADVFPFEVLADDFPRDFLADDFPLDFFLEAVPRTGDLLPFAGVRFDASNRKAVPSSIVWAMLPFLEMERFLLDLAPTGSSSWILSIDFLFEVEVEPFLWEPGDLDRLDFGDLLFDLLDLGDLLLDLLLEPLLEVDRLPPVL